MISLVALNKADFNKKDAPELQSLLEEKSLFLKTCLRELYLISEQDHQKLLDKNFDLSSYKTTKNLKALEALIKILSGLESPVLGETEVLGQFKEQVLPQLKSKPEFLEVVQYILSMVKIIRSKHLIGLGSQTYGSLVRRILKGEKHVLFVGAGGLTESILPWLRDKKAITISTRCPKKYARKEIFKGLHFNNLLQELKFDFDLSVVVCAPVSSENLKKHLPLGKIKTVVDLRAESSKDPLVLNSAKVVSLENIFEELRTKDDKKKDILQAVEKDLEESLCEKFTKHRPFGWDDLCM